MKLVLGTNIYITGDGIKNVELKNLHTSRRILNIHQIIYPSVLHNSPFCITYTISSIIIVLGSTSEIKPVILTRVEVLYLN